MTIQEFNNGNFPMYQKAEKFNVNGLDFQRINRGIKDAISSNYRYAEGNANNTNNKAADEYSNYYRKQLSDEKWMCLRISDHSPDIYKTYLQFTRQLIPSSNPFANICLMFYGNKEQHSGRKMSFKITDKLPRLIVKEEELRLFHDFNYTIYHFIPGMIEEDEIQKMVESINTWFSGDGNVEYRNLLNNKEFVIGYNNNNKPIIRELNAVGNIINATVFIKSKQMLQLEEIEAMNESNINLEMDEEIDIAEIIVSNAKPGSDNYYKMVMKINSIQIQNIEAFKPEPTMQDIYDDYLRKTWNIPPFKK